MASGGGRRLGHVQRCLSSAAAAPAHEPEPDGHHSMVFVESLASSHLPGVSLDEARFFKEHGATAVDFPGKRTVSSHFPDKHHHFSSCLPQFWLSFGETWLSGLFVKRGLLDASMLAKAQDLLLSEAERLGPGFKRDDPSSWLAHPPDTWPAPLPPGPSPPAKDHRDYKGGTGTRWV